MVFLKKSYFMVGAFYRGFQTLTPFKGNKLKMDNLFLKGNR